MSCSDNINVSDIDETPDPIPGHSNNQPVSFNDTYNNFAETYGATRYLISQSGPANFEENLFIKEVMSQTQYPDLLEKTLQEQFERFKNLSIEQALTELQKDGILTSLQKNFLLEVYDEMEYAYSSGNGLDDIAGKISYSFDTNGLLEHFNDSETAILQYFGVNMLIAHNKVISSGDLKCPWYKVIACGALAASAVIVTAIIVNQFANGDASDILQAITSVCRIFDALGIDFGVSISPGTLQGVITFLESRGINTAGLTGNQLACATALTTGIFSFVYNACCGDEVDEIPDPCDSINCGLGYRCDNGNCIPIPGHCGNTGGCPDGYRCSTAGNCVLIPVCTRCDFDEVCINGRCVPK